MFYLPHTLHPYITLLTGVYLVSALLMALLVPHLVATWTLSHSKRVLPSPFLRWHPACPNSVNVHGFAVLRPDNAEKRDLWLLALFPLGNTVMVMFYALVIPCVLVRSIYVMLRFGSEAKYQRWLRSY